MDDNSKHQFIHKDGDIVTARQLGRKIAAELEFPKPEQALIATAISELARNIVNYAGEGEIEISVVQSGRRSGLQIVAKDNGPGIEDIESAMQDGFSTGNSLGLGLPGTRRIMDDFEIESPSTGGLIVRAVKWRMR